MKKKLFLLVLVICSLKVNAQSIIVKSGQQSAGSNYVRGTEVIATSYAFPERIH